MGRIPRVPSQLTLGPFTLDEARAAGLSKRQLQGRSWSRISPRTYLYRRLQGDPLMLIRGALLRLPPDAVLSCATALWAHGVDLDPCNPIDAAVVNDNGISVRVGIRISRAEIAPAEVVIRQGLRVTSVERALADLAPKLTLVEAVVAADMALNARLTDRVALEQKLADRAGRPGAKAFRRMIHLADPGAESPMETRLRVLLVRAGLPAPETQVELKNQYGAVIARVDLFYEAARLAVEYDGDVHRQQLAQDLRRQNDLLAAGYQLLRFTAADVYRRPDEVIDRVRLALKNVPPLAAARLRSA